jgi:hypothetical protein
MQVGQVGDIADGHGHIVRGHGSIPIEALRGGSQTAGPLVL